MCPSLSPRINLHISPLSRHARPLPRTHARPTYTPLVRLCLRSIRLRQGGFPGLLAAVLVPPFSQVHLFRRGVAARVGVRVRMRVLAVGLGTRHLADL